MRGLEVAARDGGREDLGAQSQSWTLFLERECNYENLQKLPTWMAPRWIWKGRSSLVLLAVDVAGEKEKFTMGAHFLGL